GAHTLDVSGFIIHRKEGENVYPILQARVVSLGVFVLHERRLAALTSSERTEVEQRIDLRNPLTLIPSSCTDYTTSNGPSRTQLLRIDSDLREKAVGVISGVVMEMKASRDPLASEWRTGLPTFMTGGGANLAWYESVLAFADERIKNRTYA